MTRFVTCTIADMRRGRETSRVFIALCAPAFAATVLLMVIVPRVG